MATFVWKYFQIDNKPLITTIDPLPDRERHSNDVNVRNKKLTTYVNNLSLTDRNSYKVTTMSFTNSNDAKKSSRKLSFFKTFMSLDHR